jgi:hypothetical protein
LFDHLVKIIYRAHLEILSLTALLRKEGIHLTACATKGATSRRKRRTLASFGFLCCAP